MQEQAFLNELEQLGLLEIEDVSKPYPSFGAKRIPLDSATGIQRDSILLIFNVFVSNFKKDFYVLHLHQNCIWAPLFAAIFTTSST